VTVRNESAAEGAAPSIIAGVWQGAVGTVAMSVVMLGAQRLGLLGKQPPEEIVEHGLRRGLGVRAGETVENCLAVAAHIGFGASAGAVFAGLHRSVRQPPSALTGMVYGLLIWLASYSGWVPALRIMPPPSRDRPGRPATMILAHLAYGGVLGGRLGRPPQASAGSRGAGSKPA